MCWKGRDEGQCGERPAVKNSRERGFQARAGEQLGHSGQEGAAQLQACAKRRALETGDTAFSGGGWGNLRLWVHRKLLQEATRVSTNNDG